MNNKTRHQKHRGGDEITRFDNQTSVHGSGKKLRSIGALRKAIKTKPRSPDVTGKLSLQRHTFEAIANEFDEAGGDEVSYNIAGWKNHDQHGSYLTVELSTRFVPHRQRTPKSGIFDDIFDGEDE